MATFSVGADTESAVASIEAIIAVLRKTGKEANLTEKQIEEMIDATRKASKEGKKNLGDLNNGFNSLQGSIKKAGGAVAAYFTADLLKQFITDVIRVTAEFQKFEAVLTNTLGSKSAAQQSLRMIREFAAKTPYSVAELTGSFVKLANQGFKPTASEMRKLGDLAASTGKDFDMLTEAIIDAQTGEFERLKEFGIRASKSGDEVKFTFKGVETQTKFTSEAIREYILSLGDATGVSGAMAAISETLGGRISNLGDSWDTFMTTLGDSNKGILASTIAAIDDLVKGSTELVKTWEQIKSEEVTTLAGAAFNRYKSFKTEVEQAEFKQKLYQRLLKLQMDIAQVEKNGGIGLGGRTRIGSIKEFQQAEIDIKAIQDAIALIANYNEGIAEQEKREQKKSTTTTQIHLKRKTEFEQLLEWNRMLEKESEDAQKRIDKLLETINAESIAGASAELDAMLMAEIAKRRESLGGFVDTSYTPPEEETDAHKDAIDSLKSYTIAALEEVWNFRVLNTQRQMALLDKQYAYEMELAGTNKDAQLAIKNQFNKKSLELQRKEAQQQREAAIFSMLINEGPAIAKTASTLGYPLAIPFVLAVATLFGLQIAKMKSVPVPKYAEGEYGIDGPGTETSDSITAQLSKNESVVKASTSKKFKDILKPMIEGDLSYHDIKSIVDKKIGTELAAPVFIAKGDSDEKTAKKIDELKRVMEKMPINHFHWDEHGFHRSLEKDGQWTKYLNEAHR